MDPFRLLEENKCQICGRPFMEAKKLYRHLFDGHGMSKDEITVIKSRKRKDKVMAQSSSQEKPVYPCEICRKPFLSKLGLNNHKVKSHNFPQKTSSSANMKRVLCSVNVCSKRFVTFFDLANHCYEEHGNLVTDPEVFRIHRRKFENFNMFQAWKTDQESRTDSRFFVRSTESKCSSIGSKTWAMKCNQTQRAGSQLESIHSHCPAFIRVVQRHSGRVEVVACFGHLGHPHSSQNVEPREYSKKTANDHQSSSYTSSNGPSYPEYFPQSEEETFEKLVESF